MNQRIVNNKSPLIKESIEKKIFSELVSAKRYNETMNPEANPIKIPSIISLI